MEVEVKIRLNEHSYHQTLSLFKRLDAKLIRIDSQKNTFIDTCQELNSRKVTFRLRKSESVLQTSCYITIKGLVSKNLENGIMKVSELETEINVEDYLKIIENPFLILDFDKYELIKTLKAETISRKFSISGEFSTIRHIYDYDEMKIEVDETIYEFGNAYEIEIENTDPVKTKEKIERILGNANIEFAYSKRSKFANFISKSVK
jgi:uncharacterized protein YjbK